MLSVINGEEERTEMAVSLDEICRQGAQQMLAAAMEAEVAEYVGGLAGEVDATAAMNRVQSRRLLARLRFTNRGWTIVVSIPRPVRSAGSGPG